MNIWIEGEGKAQRANRQKRRRKKGGGFKKTSLKMERERAKKLDENWIGHLTLQRRQRQTKNC
jgi:hypothetical protein